MVFSRSIRAALLLGGQVKVQAYTLAYADGIITSFILYAFRRRAYNHYTRQA